MSIEAIEEFAELAGITILSHGNHHCRQGWRQLCCPFCIEGDSSYHLGYSLEGNSFVCYKCGWHPIYTVVAALLDCNFTQAREYERKIFKTFYRKKGDASASSSLDSFESASGNMLTRVKVPSSGNIIEMREPYIYLRKRFRWMSEVEFKAMIVTYQITATNTSASAYRGRIVFPNIYNGKIVSFQTRDYTNHSRAKYITAKPEEELIHHKDFLWGLDRVQTDKVVVCEGVMDALSGGDGFLHTHGIKWTEQQSVCLRSFRQVYVCYDKEDQALEQARNLAHDLESYTKVTIVKLKDGKDLNSTSNSEREDVIALLK